MWIVDKLDGFVNVDYLSQIVVEETAAWERGNYVVNGIFAHSGAKIPLEYCRTKDEAVASVCCLIQGLNVGQKK